MSRVISALATISLPVVAYRSIPLVWEQYRVDAFIIGCALALLFIDNLYEAITGEKL